MQNIKEKKANEDRLGQMGLLDGQLLNMEYSIKLGYFGTLCNDKYGCRLRTTKVWLAEGIIIIL